MIRPININLNAAHPELPLVEATTFTGAPSSVFIRGVPKAVGNWSITAVSVAVTYPDNTTTARAAVESAEGVWVATIPGTATSGRTAAGFKIMADGIDENGAAVTGYVLGFADFSVLSFTPVPAPGGTFYFLRYFDQAPATPKEGDVAKIDGVLKFYNGSAWETFAASVTLDNTVTRTSANGVKSSGIWSAIWGALAALPTGVTSLYDWCVAQIAKLRGKTDLNVYGYGNASVTFPDGFSITYMSGDTYTAPSGGETIEFYGPITSTAVPQYNFWVPYEYKDATNFDPAAQAVWCLYGSIGNSAPSYLMYRAGASYSIANWNTVDPTLTLSYGEATGDAPTMARPLGATGDTLVKMSQMNSALAGKANRAPDPTDGNLATLDSQGNPVDSGKTPYDFALADIIAPEWDFNSTYEVGDLCTSFDNDPSHMGTWLYKCILAPAPQQMMPPEVDTTHWTLATVEDVLAALRTAIANKANDSAIAPEFSATSTYDVGDVVMHEGARYKCTTAVTTAGAWSTVSSSFTAEDVQTAIEAGGGGDYASKVSGATVGHLASLTATGDLADSGKSAADFMDANAHIRRLWAAGDVSTADAVGALMNTTLQDSKWTCSFGTTGSPYVEGSTLVEWSFNGNENIRYNPSTGEMTYRRYYSNSWHATALSPTQPRGIDPTIEGAMLGNVTGKRYNDSTTYTFIFTPKSYQESSLNTHLALETVPTRTIAASTAYAVGDLLGDGGKAYRCILSYTSAATPVAPSSDTTHWQEISVLAQKADASAIPYSLVTKTISNNAVTLDDRASNAVTISTTLSPNTLTINFPTATSGKVRDFAMRLNIAAGVTAPEIAWPQGVTLENDGGEVPEIADGGTGGSSTILYFSESENNGTTAKFTVKGETLTAIAQA